VLKLGQDVLHGGRWLSGDRLSSDRLSSFIPELSSEDIQVKKSKAMHQTWVKGRDSIERKGRGHQ